LDTCGILSNFLDKSQKTKEDKPKIVSDSETKIKYSEKCKNKKVNTVHDITVYNYTKDDIKVDKNLKYEKYDSDDETELAIEIREYLELDSNSIIEYRDHDGFINVTNLCKMIDEEFNIWKCKRGKIFLKFLSSNIKIPISKLMKYEVNLTHDKSIWVHPYIAVNLAQFIDPESEVKIIDWIHEILIYKKADIRSSKIYRKLKKSNKQLTDRITFLENKYLQKHKRTENNVNNVIYVLTTESSKKNNIYILGKASNLTNRSKGWFKFLRWIAQTLE
jgi:hypothetical protein